MSLVDVAELPRLFSPQLSPDGRTLAYFVSRPDWKTNRLVFHMWRQSVAGGKPAQLTFTEAGDVPAGLRWAPDGKTLLFLREGQAWLLPTDGGEPRALTRHSTGVSSPSFSPDGGVVYFIAPDPRSPEENERARVRDDVYAFDENAKQRHLWKIVVSTGAETPVTAGEFSVTDYRLSADGTRIALTRAPTAAEGAAARGEVWVMDASGEHARPLTHNTVAESGLDISPDNSQILFLANANARFEPYYPTTLFVVSTAGGAPRPVVSDFKYSFDQAVWSGDSRYVLATVNMGVHSEIFRIDTRSGHARQITDGAHFFPPGWSLAAAAQRLVFQIDEPTRFGDVWTLPADGSSASPVRVTHLFDPLEREFSLPRQAKVEWTGADGTPIEGVLMYPLDYVEGTRYPVVVQLHGGPMESDKFGAGPGLLLNYFPVLTARGYLVLRPNYRGSAGYGAAFFRDVNGGYFHQMATDVIAGVDRLVARGIADPEQVVVMGWSAGGTLVNKLVTLTPRFKAASAYAGVANWTSLWAQTDDVSFRRTWFAGTPWQKDAAIDQFWGASPLKDVANVKTPTLFFAGENDVRVPMAQSIEMYRALKSLNVPTHLYIGPREGHQWTDLRHQLFKANAELEWFETYARGRTYSWEKAPAP